MEQWKMLEKEGRINNQWLVLDLDFKIISKHDTAHEASQSINVSRQAANASYRYARPILRNFYICRPIQLAQLKQKIEVKKKKCLVTRFRIYKECES